MCLFVLLSRQLLLAFLYCKRLCLEGVVGMVKKDGWVDGLPTEADFEMQVWGRGAPCLPSQADDLASLDFLPNLHEVF